MNTVTWIFLFAGMTLTTALLAFFAAIQGKRNAVLWYILSALVSAIGAILNASAL